MVYALYNYKDTLEEALQRCEKMRQLGIRVYPMRYKPLDWVDSQNRYVSPLWTPEDLADFYAFWKSYFHPAYSTFEEWRKNGPHRMTEAEREFRDSKINEKAKDIKNCVGSKYFYPSKAVDFIGKDKDSLLMDRKFVEKYINNESIELDE